MFTGLHYGAFFYFMDYKEYFQKRNLLTSGKSNTKTAKNSMETFYLSLQPTNLNSKGENLCKFSTKECRRDCLQFAGRQGFDNVVQSRSKKTEFFVLHKKEFLTKLWNELVALDAKGKKVAIRLNLLSDVNWQDEFTNYLGTGHSIEQLQNIQFYDYTKDHFKVIYNNLKNYNLTFSFSGSNWKYCHKFLEQKSANVAVVFKNDVPSTYKGFPVVNGDVSDERYAEDKGVIVGLKYKKPKGVPYQQSKFVVEEY